MTDAQLELLRLLLQYKEDVLPDEVIQARLELEYELMRLDCPSMPAYSDLTPEELLAVTNAMVFILASIYRGELPKTGPVGEIASYGRGDGKVSFFASATRPTDTIGSWEKKGLKFMLILDPFKACFTARLQGQNSIAPTRGRRSWGKNEVAILDAHQ